MNWASSSHTKHGMKLNFHPRSSFYSYIRGQGWTWLTLNKIILVPGECRLYWFSSHEDFWYTIWNIFPPKLRILCNVLHQAVNGRQQTLNPAHGTVRSCPPSQSKGVPPGKAEKRCCPPPLIGARFPFSAHCGCWCHIPMSFAVWSHKTGYNYIFLECVKTGLEWENLVPLSYNWKTFQNLNLSNFQKKKKEKQPTKSSLFNLVTRKCGEDGKVSLLPLHRWFWFRKCASKFSACKYRKEVLFCF